MNLRKSGVEDGIRDTIKFMKITILVLACNIKRKLRKIRSLDINCFAMPLGTLGSTSKTEQIDVNDLKIKKLKCHGRQ